MCPIRARLRKRIYNYYVSYRFTKSVFCAIIVILMAYFNCICRLVHKILIGFVTFLLRKIGASDPRPRSAARTSLHPPPTGSAGDSIAFPCPRFGGPAPGARLAGGLRPRPDPGSPPGYCGSLYTSLIILIFFFFFFTIYLGGTYENSNYIYTS